MNKRLQRCKDWLAGKLPESSIIYHKGELARDRRRDPELAALADRAFAGDDPTTFLRGHGITPELVGAVGRKGFQVEPRRWKVEQTFGCLQRYRRLRVDGETSHDTSRQMTLLASVFMIGMRLQRTLSALAEQEIPLIELHSREVGQS